MVIRRGDYRAPGFLIDRVELLFDLGPTLARVESTLTLRRSPVSGAEDRLLLFGDGLTLESIALNHRPLSADSYERVDLSAAAHLMAGNPRGTRIWRRRATSNKFE